MDIEIDFFALPLLISLCLFHSPSISLLLSSLFHSHCLFPSFRPLSVFILLSLNFTSLFRLLRLFSSLSFSLLSSLLLFLLFLRAVPPHIIYLLSFHATPPPPLSPCSFSPVSLFLLSVAPEQFPQFVLLSPFLPSSAFPLFLPALTHHSSFPSFRRLSHTFSLICLPFSSPFTFCFLSKYPFFLYHSLS